MLKLDNPKHLENLRDKLVQAQKIRRDKIRAMFEKRGITIESMTFAEYMKRLPKPNKSNTTQE